MTDPEIMEWLSLLAPSNKERKEIILDFYTCPAHRDMATPPRRCQDRYGELSNEDSSICMRALTMLDSGHVPEMAGPIYIQHEAEMVEM